MSRCVAMDLCVIEIAGPDCAHLIGKRIVITEPVDLAEGPCWRYDTFDGEPLRDAYGHAMAAVEDWMLTPAPRQLQAQKADLL